MVKEWAGGSVSQSCPGGATELHQKSYAGQVRLLPQGVLRYISSINIKFIKLKSSIKIYDYWPTET
jgi:hypothetical protein